MLKSFEKFIESLMFASRWLLAPFYFGLIISLFFLLIVFIKEIIHFVTHFSTDETELILFILTLIDLSFAGYLLIIVIFSGYENFVSKINISNHEDKPEWMGTVDFGGLKLKLVSSINAQIWLGHFDIWDKEGLIIYRNSSIIDRNNLNLENVETLLLDAVNSIDLYFPAFQYILWAGKTSEEALSTVLFETRGEA